MKKAYFITYLGAFLSCIVTAFGIKKVTKKYGQPLKEKKFSIYSIFGSADKILSLLANRK